MIVYSSLLHLVDADPRPAVRAALKAWLETKTRHDLSDEQLHQGRHDLGRAQRLEIEEFDYLEDPAPSHRRPEHDWSVAFRYSHPDRAVRGRRWITEVGLSLWSNRSIATIRLLTEEQSALANKPVATTRPGVVDLIQSSCTLHAKTPGRTVHALGLHDVDAFVEHLRDRDRRHPVFVLSPHQDGGHAVDPIRLANLCIGIADVAAIPDGVDTFALEHALGAGMCPYRGAVDIVWPMASGEGLRRIARTRILAEHFEEMRFQQRDPHGELLARVCHETNAMVAWHHGDLASVRSLRLRRELESAREKLSRAVPPGERELLTMYEQVEKEDKQKIQGLEERVQQLEGDLVAQRAATGEAEQATREAQHKAEALEHALRESKRGSTTDAGDRQRLREAVQRALQKEPTLEDSLVVLDHLFPDRLVILDTAWKSARAAAKFRDGKKAFDLLWKLGTGYHDAMCAGGGDKQALQVFGNTSFAARESETVESNTKARSLRTFVYRGESIEMVRHLKIGVKPSDATTFRAHFHWDAANKVVVLGHCGGHLDHD